MAFPRYESYRDSGVDWLGEIPTNWKIQRLGTVFDERKEKVSDKDFPPLSVTKNGVLPQLESAAKSDDGDNRKGVREGDFVINSRSDRKGSSGIAKQDGSVSLINIVLKPKYINPRYCEHLLKSNGFIEEFYRNGHGIVADLWTTRYWDMKSILIPLPGLPTQERIANFLGQKTAEIDEAIAKKQRLIELLKEQKAILINQAVTKGLNPDVSMRDSGVEWIGEVPAHWEVKRLKYCTKIFRGKFTHRPRNDPSLYDGLYPFIQTGDVARSGKFLVDYTQTLNEKGLKVSTLIPRGTVVITIAANIGDIAILGIDACFPDSIVGFNAESEIDRDYLYYVLSAMKEQFVNSTIKNTQMNLNVDRIGSNSVAFPLLDEQKQIVKHIEKCEQNIIALANETMVTIKQLNELKQVLITEAVTGKIKI